MGDTISSGTRSSSKKQIEKLAKANSELKKDKLMLESEVADLKEKLDLVTSELEQLKLKKGNSF